MAGGGVIDAPVVDLIISLYCHLNMYKPEIPT